MTQLEIYNNFMIEYDKAQITSSYPSLTKTEIATLLNKAYLALLAQKISGNNPRKAAFEYDTKAIEDLRLLEAQTELNAADGVNGALNELIYKLPNKYLYYIDCTITVNKEQSALDNRTNRRLNTQLLNHDLAKTFKCTDTNMPWVRQPITYIEGDNIHILVDPYKYKNGIDKVNLVYIKLPIKFTKEFSNTVDFELSDTMAEELINLAILFATESVESPRLQTKSSLLTLES